MIELRAYRASDAETIISWIHDEASFRKWCADRYDKFPITPDDINRNYAACAESGGFFPITIAEHLDLLKNTGFGSSELFWHSYMQSGFYAIKGE